MRYDKARRVVKALKGLSAPTLPQFKPFNNPKGFDQMMYNNMANFSTKIDWEPSYYNQGSEIPMPKASSIDASIDFTPEVPQLYSSKEYPEAPTIRDFNTPDDYPDYMKSAAEFNVSTKNFLSDLKGNKFTYNPEFQRKTMFDKNIFQKMTGGIKDFAKNNPNLINTGINMGLDYIGSQFDKGVYNNKGTETVLGISKTLGNLHPVLKLADTALRGTNKLLGKQSDSYHVDKQLQAQMGGGYTGSFKFMNEAENDLNKFYGFLSTGSRQNAESRGRQAVAIGQKIGDIRDTNADMQAMAGNDLNYLNYESRSNGGYDMRYMRAAKQGMKISDRIELVKQRRIVKNIINLDTKEIEWEPVIIDQIESFKKGGSIPELEWEPTIIVEVFQEGGKIRSLEELIEYAKKENPRFIQRLSEQPRGINFIDHEGNDAYGSHYLMSAGDLVVPQIQEVDGELKFFDEEDAVNRAIEKGNYLKMSPEEAIIFAEGYKQGWPKFFFKEVYDYYKDYDLNGVNIIQGGEPRTEGNNIYVNNDEDAVHELWHYISQNKPNEKYREYYDNLNDDRIVELGGNLDFVKRTGDPGDFYNPSELEARIMAAKYKTQGQHYNKEFFQNLRSDENKFGYNMRDLLYMFNNENLEKIFNLKKGGSLGEELETPEIEETNQKNLIPEGALHKNKHHMEHTEGLTQKGIPVIDNDGEQQAEIELDEIIFTLEVTKKLEELYKDGSDGAAIEAGKLLVKEILFNTDDRTGLISKCEKGGKL